MSRKWGTTPSVTFQKSVVIGVMPISAGRDKIRARISSAHNKSGKKFRKIAEYKLSKKNLKIVMFVEPTVYHFLTKFDI